MDQALKQRLVGATVLIILGVILLPMLLSGQSDLSNESPAIELPDKPPELSMDKRRFPIGQQSAERPSRVPETAEDAGAGQASDRESGAVIDAASQRTDAPESLAAHSPVTGPDPVADHATSTTESSSSARANGTNTTIVPVQAHSAADGRFAQPRAAGCARNSDYRVPGRTGRTIRPCPGEVGHVGIEVTPYATTPIASRDPNGDAASLK